MSFQDENKQSLTSLQSDGKNKNALYDTLQLFEKRLLAIETGKTKEPYSESDMAWINYRSFEKNLYINSTIDEYLEQSKSYLKDSTQIVLVKLKGLQILDERGLLKKDILQNSDYYIDLLDEFERSDLDPRLYLYFENKIRKVTQERVIEKYQRSILLNLIGIVTIGGLSYGFIRKKKKKLSLNPLSNQEEKIKNLIMEGKSNKEIANELFISVSTVKTHTSNIYSKLAIKSRKDLQGNT